LERNRLRDHCAKLEAQCAAMREALRDLYEATAPRFAQDPMKYLEHAEAALKSDAGAVFTARLQAAEAVCRVFPEILRIARYEKTRNTEEFLSAAGSVLAEWEKVSK
jgi:hypothetical protein